MRLRMIKVAIASGTRLGRIQARGERLSSGMEAAAIVLGGIVAVVRGLQTLCEIIAPPPAEEAPATNT